MAHVEHALIGYVNPDTVRLGIITSKENRPDGHALPAEKTVYYWMITAGKDSFESTKYDTEGEAITARSQMKTDLGI